MKAHKVETRTDAVIRWLERMKSAYRSGAVESAYIDAECARADLETLRTDVFADISPFRRNVSDIIGRFFSAALLSLFAVLLVPFPLSHERDAVSDIALVQQVPPPSGCRGVVAVVVAEVPPRAAVSVPRKTVRRKPPPRKHARRLGLAKAPSPPHARPHKAPPRPKSIAHDKIYSLIQTGRRALDNDMSVITIN